MNTPRTNHPLTNVLLSVIIALLTGILLLQVVRLRAAARGGDELSRDTGQSGQAALPRLAPRLASQPGSPLSVRPRDLDDFWPSADSFAGIHARAQQILQEARARFETMGKERQGNDATKPLAPPPAFREMEDQFNRMFEQAFGDMQHFGMGTGFDDGWNHLEATPAIDLHEEGSNYVVSVGLGAMEDPKVKLSLRGDLLVVEAEQNVESSKATAAGDSRLQTLSQQRFTRAIRLPGATTDIDAIATHYENGTLRVVVPRVRDAKPLERQIRIK